MEPERLVGHMVLFFNHQTNFTPSVSFAEFYFRGGVFQRDCSVDGSFCLRVSSGFACSRFAPSALKTCESLPIEPLSCISNSKVERGQSQGAKYPALICRKLFACNLASTFWLFGLFDRWLGQNGLNGLGQSLRHGRSYRHNCSG